MPRVLWGTAASRSSAETKRLACPASATTCSTSVVLPTCRGPVTICRKRRGSRSLAARIAD